MRFYSLILGLTLGLAVSSCGSDDNESGNGSNSEQGNTTQVDVNNTNKYLVTEQTPGIVTSLEFPKLRGGSSAVVAHYANGAFNYAVEWDRDLKSCRWSCYKIDDSNNMQNVSRYYPSSKGQPQYPQDEDFPDSWLANDPFYSSGYDHGHMCPSQDRVNSFMANYQTFYLTNMMPQLNNFNAYVWATMEAWVRNKKKESIKDSNGNTHPFADTLYVVKGGTIDKSEQILPNKVHGMVIPQYYYAVVLCKNYLGYRAIGFWFKHEANSSKNLSPYVVNVDDLEEKTGIDFFCNLPDDIENKVESTPVENIKRLWGLSN